MSADHKALSLTHKLSSAGQVLSSDYWGNNPSVQIRIISIPPTDPKGRMAKISSAHTESGLSQLYATASDQTVFSEGKWPFPKRLLSSSRQGSSDGPEPPAPLRFQLLDSLGPGAKRWHHLSHNTSPSKRRTTGWWQRNGGSR